MIHAYALEPELVASWSERHEYRFIYDKFGPGTPRAMLELPSFTEWKRAVHTVVATLGLSAEDLKRLEELFRILGECRCRRSDSVYDVALSWLENGEREYDRRPFAAVIATSNPRGHPAVLLGSNLEPTDPRWARATGVTADRTPEALSTALSEMLTNCRELHLIDPHFGPENRRHRMVLESLLRVISDNGIAPNVIRVHCLAKSTLTFFQDSARSMAGRLPVGITVEFTRWNPRDPGEEGDRLHNRYVLTDLGGVSLGVGLDAGRAAGETDDLLLLPQEQYLRRWGEYAQNDGAFELADIPVAIQGQWRPPPRRGRR